VLRLLLLRRPLLRMRRPPRPSSANASAEKGCGCGCCCSLLPALRCSALNVERDPMFLFRFLPFF
jgi:hypothetical protein